MKLNIDFPELDRDDKPVFDWNKPDYGRYQSRGQMQPKFWRAPVRPLPRWTPTEVMKCFFFGCLWFAFLFAFLAVLFCWM